MKSKVLLFAFIIALFSCEPTAEEAELLNGNLITAFSVQSGGTPLDVQISGTDIQVIIPYSLDLGQILVSLSLSEGAEVNPKPEAVNIIVDGLTFTVTAENGDKRTYNVTVVQELSPENDLLSFIIKDAEENIEAVIDTTSNLISYILPYTADLTQLDTEVTISPKATIDPDPTAITDYSETVSYTVTAENGNTKEYEVSLNREASPENDMLSFVIANDSLPITANIDLVNKTVIQKLPSSFDLSQLPVGITISENATIIPDPVTISDYSSPVVFQIFSEKDEVAEYTVSLSTMTDNVFINCETDNASKWFGGDKRAYEVDPEYYFEPRNVGTGQSIVPTQDLNLTKFSVHFRGQFETTYLPYQVYQGEFEIRLQLRNAEGEILVTTDTTVQSPITTSLWIPFDLEQFNLVLKKDTVYYLTWYMVNGEELGIVGGSTGNQNAHSGECDGIGLSGTSKMLLENHLDEWDTWHEHPWHFNFRLEGKE